MIAHRKAIISSLIVAFCCVGCQQRDADFHDPLLRQQLTEMVSNLSSDRAVPKATKDLDAILLVNSSKLSVDQSTKLRSALEKLRGVRVTVDEFVRAQQQPDYSEAKRDKYYNTYGTLLREAKVLIGEAAAAF